jgi:microcin C transport system permease protein
MAACTACNGEQGGLSSPISRHVFTSPRPEVNRLGEARLPIWQESADMLPFFLNRLLLMIPTLFGILLLTFAVIQFVPGGPVEQMVAQLQGRDSGGEGAAASGAGYRGRQGVDAARIEEIKQLYGFDKPAPERFWQMLGQFARFDLGKSFFYPKDVWQLVKEKLPVSISLGLWTFFLSYLVSVPLGIAKAVRAGTRFDTLTSLVVLVGYAIPGFVLGVALLVVFGGQLQWFPLRGLTSANWESLSWGAKVVDYLWHIAMPITASVLGAFAVTTMLTKNAFLEEIGKQYVLTARAKGLSENTVLWKHVMRNALIPLVTGFPAAFIGSFFTGSLLIETLFSLDGLGLLSFESVMRRDYPVVLGTLYLFTLIGLVTKLISDLCYVWVDPRVKFD